MDGIRMVPMSGNRAMRQSATDTYPIICNAFPDLYPGAGVTLADPASDMDAVIRLNRAVVWRVPVGAVNGPSVSLDLDLGPDLGTIDTMGVTGLVCPSGATPPTVTMYYKTAEAGWSSAWAAWGPIPAGTDASFVRDNPVFGVRYVRATFSGVSSLTEFSLSGLLAALGIITGVEFAVGTTESYSLQRSDVSTMSGVKYVTEYGDPIWTAELRFGSMTLAQRNSIIAIAQALLPFSLVWPGGVTRMCRAVGSDKSTATVYPRWTIEFSVESVV